MPHDINIFELAKSERARRITLKNPANLCISFNPLRVRAVRNRITRIERKARVANLYARLADLQGQLEDRGVSFTSQPDAKDLLSTAYADFKKSFDETRSRVQANASVDWGRLPQKPISPQRRPEETSASRGLRGTFNYNREEVRRAVEPNVTLGQSGYAASYA